MDEEATPLYILDACGWSELIQKMREHVLLGEDFLAGSAGAVRALHEDLQKLEGLLEEE